MYNSVILEDTYRYNSDLNWTVYNDKSGEEGYDSYDDYEYDDFKWEDLTGQDQHR